jgi:AcrR family transcriptional regulator
MTREPLTTDQGGAAQPRRRPRRDAEANRERLLAAAAAAMAREGRHVQLAVIAAEAGVGVGTLYRRYADRDALMQALEEREHPRAAGQPGGYRGSLWSTTR